MNLPQPGLVWDRIKEMQRNRAIAAADRANLKTDTDNYINDGRIILKSPDGSLFYLTVSNAGALTATAL